MAFLGPEFVSSLLTKILAVIISRQNRASCTIDHRQLKNRNHGREYLLFVCSHPLSKKMEKC
jgi:hypothetical protein